MTEVDDDEDPPADDRVRVSFEITSEVMSLADLYERAVGARDRVADPPDDGPWPAESARRRADRRRPDSTA